MELGFTSRGDLSDYEWDFQKEDWKRPELDREVLKKLSERNSWNGLYRIAILAFFLIASAVAAIFIGQRYGWIWAIPLIYVYYFFYGFLTSLGHELQHRTVFGKSLDWLNETLFFMVQVLTWNSPRHARISHRLHHRYTMVRGTDPETDWPEVITVGWLRGFLLNQAARLLVVGAVVELFRSVVLQVKRMLGRKDAMMSHYCSDKDIRAIRIESSAILLIHLSVVVLAILLGRWELLLFVTLAWQIGTAMESLWHYTEHIGRAYNVKDQRLCTRSIRVGPFIRLIYWGLDDHVDHHDFPVVPSYHLPELHRILKGSLAEPRNIIGCWAEMFAIAKEREKHPENEYVPVPIE